MTAIIIIVFCIAIGPLGWFWLAVGGGLLLWLNNKPSDSYPDRDIQVPLRKPSQADCQWGELVFDSCDWEQVGDNTFRNIRNGVSFRRDNFGRWEADDDGSGENSEYYGYYRVED